jgi:hypothetical protein
MHWALDFASLADEDDWAAKIIQDERCTGWSKGASGVMSPPVDRLYRDAPM